MDNTFCKSEQGVFQGVVWGTVVASCLLLDFQHEINDALQSEISVEASDGSQATEPEYHINIAVADDWAIIADPQTIIKAWNFLQKNAPPKNSRTL